ncbi:MAG: urease subunit gamma [Intrasporangium sp.]|uniref:urease subunit gamma n=1 Tax=Intrasporangium sp. TaxID=1925024 RepID=UPI00264972BC|nr:urease subunit gamma [Intrasporangium sp.]MDN5797402.1 urease subunit gamma [Intrasporangium sp.]
MHLTPQEHDRLLLFTAAELARARRSRGLRLNVPEAIALVADTVCEAARDGARLAQAVAAGSAVLDGDDVLPGVADVVRRVEVEAVFDDGTRLAIVQEPFGPPSASVLAPGHLEVAPVAPQPPTDVVEVVVVNESPVPISVTSHFHFFEVNPRLRFERAAAWGRHLAVPAGAVQRFDPGMPLTVALVPFGGERVMVGFAGLVDGPLDAPGAKQAGLARAHACGYLGAEPSAEPTTGGER